MNQASENNRGALVTDNQSPEVLQPGIGTFNDPAIAITPQMPSILMSGLGVVFSGRDDGQHPAAFDQLPGFIAVITFEDIVRVFGAPQLGNSLDNKIKVEWVGRINGLVFTIYDYKSKLDPERNTDWHIGGKHKFAAELVNIYFKANS